MKREWIIETVKYIKKVNAVRYKVIKRYSCEDNAIDFFNKNKKKSIVLSNSYSVNTDYPIFAMTDKGYKELDKVRD